MSWTRLHEARESRSQTDIVPLYFSGRLELTQNEYLGGYIPTELGSMTALSEFVLKKIREMSTGLSLMFSANLLLMFSSFSWRWATRSVWNFAHGTWTAQKA